MVLAAHSDVFRAMLLGEFKEVKEDRVEIKDISVDTFNKIVEILYYGRMSECGALKFVTAVHEVGDYTSFYHWKGRDISSVEDSYPSKHSNFTKDNLFEFWNFVNELLVAADRFNVTELVLKSLQDVILKTICTRRECFFCLNLLMLSFEKKMSILDKFPSFTKSNCEVWHNAVSRNCVLFDNSPFLEEQKQLLSMNNKFT